MASSAVNVVRTIAPFDRLSNNDYFVRKYTLTTTARADALPAAWAGKEVEVTVFGMVAANNYAVFGISKNSGATIDADNGTAAPSNAGTATNIGQYLANTQTARIRLPTCGNESLYLVRDMNAADAAAFMLVRLASD